MAPSYPGGQSAIKARGLYRNGAALIMVLRLDAIQRLRGLMADPKVSIAIVVSGAPEGLERAVRSARAQSHANIEILICDGVLSQDSAAVAKSLAADDPRIRTIRKGQKLGVIDACTTAWHAAQGDYFLWLDDQTWLDPNYVALGVGFLEENAAHVLAYGTVAWRDAGGEARTRLPASVAYEDPVRRVELLLTNMSGGEAWYGLHRRRLLETMTLSGGLGFYYAWLASVAWRGKIAALPEMILHRSRPLDEADASEEVVRLGAGSFQATDRWLTVAALLFCNIAFFDRAMADLPFLERVRLAATAADAIAHRRKVLDEGMLISFASRLFPSEHVVEHFRDMRTALADAVMRLPALSSTDPFAQNLVGTINVLCRMRIGNIPMTKEDQDIVRQLEIMWDRDKKPGAQNKVAVVSAMYL
jgi:glycosyltransferase involved in cell wall biosynthesis